MAQHPRLPRREALKVLRTDVSADPDYRARFEREADLAAALFHPHVVGVHDRGESNGQLWIAMDYVEGTDADRLIRGFHTPGEGTNSTGVNISRRFWGQRERLRRVPTRAVPPPGCGTEGHNRSSDPCR